MQAERSFLPMRIFLLIRNALVLLLLLGALAPAARADDTLGRGADELTPEVVAAVDGALGWLARRQNDDGSWKADVGFKLNQNYEVTEDNKPHVGVTSLAALAFLAAGHLPGRGGYGDNLERAVGYLLRHVNEEGYVTDNGTRMYSHAFATLLLAEVYGMTGRADIRDKLQAAVDLIVECQNAEGSWRYVPFAVESDMSITVCQLNALRAARNIGIRVPRSTIDRASAYIARSYIEQDSSPRFMFSDYYKLGRGAFKYQAQRDTRSSFALTAAGLAALHNAGMYGSNLATVEGVGDDIDLAASIDFLKDHYESVSSGPYRFHYFYWYGHYYATQALYVIGGEPWRWYYPRVRRELLDAQAEDGSLPCTIGPGTAFSTSVGALILALPYGYLPIFTR